MVIYTRGNGVDANTIYRNGQPWVKLELLVERWDGEVDSVDHVVKLLNRAAGCRKRS